MNAFKFQLVRPFSFFSVLVFTQIAIMEIVNNLQRKAVDLERCKKYMLQSTTWQTITTESEKLRSPSCHCGIHPSSYW